MEKQLSIDAEEFSGIMLCAFRYALGRRTYITMECADWLTKYWDTLPPFMKKQMHRDIERAISMNLAGDKCDVEQWKRVLKLPLAADDDSKTLQT